MATTPRGMLFLFIPSVLNDQGGSCSVTSDEIPREIITDPYCGAAG